MVNGHYGRRNKESKTRNEGNSKKPTGDANIGFENVIKIVDIQISTWRISENWNLQKRTKEKSQN